MAKLKSSMVVNIVLVCILVLILSLKAYAQDSCLTGTWTSSGKPHISFDLTQNGNTLTGSWTNVNSGCIYDGTGTFDSSTDAVSITFSTRFWSPTTCCAQFSYTGIVNSFDELLLNWNNSCCSYGGTSVFYTSGQSNTISTTSKSFESSGSTGSVSVMTASGCTWTATSNDTWITISLGSRNGDGTVDYSVSDNTSTCSRTGTMTIAGNTFTVTQDGTCGTSIIPVSHNFAYFAKTDSVDVGDPCSCGWTAVTNDPDWITVESGSSGIGNGTVTYSVLENTKTDPRSGTITIADRTFTMTQGGTDIIDNVAPSIEIDNLVDGSTRERVHFIHGTSSDDDPSSGIDRVEIQVSYGIGSKSYLGSDGKWSITEQWITASDSELLFYDTSNVAWEDNVGYEVTAKVYDVAGHSGEAAISFTFQINDEQLPSTLDLELSSSAILQGNTIDVSGKLTRLPDDGSNISGNAINITIMSPSAVVTSKQTATTESDGGYQIAGISGFTQKGTYTIQASFNETSEMTASSSVEVPLQVGFAGYAIIVEGKVSNEEGLDSHNKTTNNIYDTLLERGFTEDNIYYFNYDTSQTGVDAYPTKTDVGSAIVSWLLDKMNASPVPLYIVLHDHGYTDTFHLDDETITSSDLDTGLDILESGLNSNALLEKRIIIYGACYSGSFIPALSKSATATDGGRIIVTSAASDEESYKGPMEPDGIRTGSYFLEELFKELERGYSLKDSFVKVTGKTEIFTRKGDGLANTNNAYFDSAMQHPLLDDGGDGVGSNALSDNVGDGQVAKDIYLGVGETLEALPDSQAEILDVTKTLLISPFETNNLLWATVNDNDQVESAWIEIRPPSQTLSGIGGSNTNQLTTDYTKISLSLNDTSGNWEIETAAFKSSGLYEVFYFVSDKTTGEASTPLRSLVYKDKVGNNPPYTFSLVSPSPVSEERTSLMFNWNAASGPDGGDVTYTYNLLIAKDDAFNKVVYKKEEIPTTATIVGTGAGLSDLTIYYWKVQAVDDYGLITDSTQTWPFYTNNTNSIPGFIFGAVYDETTFIPIEGATISTGEGSEAASIEEGYFFLEAPEGTYTVTGSYSNYSNVSISSIRVNSGETTELNIPLANNCTYTITPTSQSFGLSDDTGSVNVSTSTECSWKATSNAAWIDIISGSSGIGDGIVGYTVSENTSGSKRTGTMTIAGETFTVTQSVLIQTGDPTPDITANNSEVTLNINEGDQLSIAISLDPGNYTGTSADWYIAVNTSSGWQSFNISQMDYSTSGISPLLQGYGLISFGPTGIFSTSSLSAGTYTYYFAVGFKWTDLL